MKKTIIIIALLVSCVDEERTVRVLADQGYTHITTDGHSRGCSDGDTYCTAFEAMAPSGRIVRGAVGCGESGGCGGGKGCTIRVF